MTFLSNFRMVNILIMLFFTAAVFSSCGKKSRKADESGSDVPTTASGDNNNDNSNNTNAPVSAPAFVVSGQLNLTSLSLTGTESLSVYAVNTAASFGSEWRKKVDIKEDNSFDIELSKGDPWVLIFIDDSKTGDAMVKAVFKADEIDSIAPLIATTSSASDLGVLTINDETQKAVMSNDKYDDFIGDLGLTSAEADILGELDDLMLRYTNPDINGNGVVDSEDPDMPDTGIIIWHGYEFNNSSAVLAKIKNKEPIPLDEALTFVGAAPELRVAETTSGVFSTMPEKISLAWTENGDYTGGNSAEYLQSVGETNRVVVFDDLNGTDGTIGFKVMFAADVTKVPEGTYTYKFFAKEGDASPSETFKFTNVKTAVNAADMTNYVFPFPLFVTDAAGEITKFTYSWQKYDGEKFVAATSRDIEMIMGKSLAEVKWGTNNDGGYMFCNWSPAEEEFATSGEIAVSGCNNNAAYTNKLSELNGIGLSFTTINGLWMRLGID